MSERQYIKIFTRFERFWHWMQALLVLVLLFTGARLHGLIGGLDWSAAFMLHLNYAVHGKQSEKLGEDDRQLAFEDLQVAVAETEEQKQDQVSGDATPKRKRVAKAFRPTFELGKEAERGKTYKCCGCFAFNP